jgi:hypothetical protein
VQFIDKANKTKDGTTISTSYPTSRTENSSDAGMGAYVVHPAFETDKSNGGWDADLAGMWVAKFEMSGTTTALKSSAGVESLRSTTIGDMFTYSQSYDTTTAVGTTTSFESHLMKNSEWGAVAYLAHSSYGRNGTEITINSSSSYYTGGVTTVNDIATVYGTNVNQSTTGNAYGIYDISGGAYERTAAFVANYTSSMSNRFTDYGSSLVDGIAYAQGTNPSASSKYVTVYYNSTSTDEQNSNYSANNYASTNKKFGDAIYETSNGYNTSNGSWNSDYSDFPYSTSPFFVRGGSHSNGSYAGSFSFDYYSGFSHSGVGFRVVCSPL